MTHQTSTALLLIDIQNDYFPGGAMELVGAEAAAQQARRLLLAFREKGRSVIHIQHLSARPGATFFLPGTPGADIHSTLIPLAGETVFQKNYPNSFRETPLLAHLRAQNINQLLVCGMMTHMCIDTTVRAAFDLGLACTLAHDACATRNLMFKNRTVSAEDVQNVYLAALHGIFSQVMSADEWLQINLKPEAGI